MKIPLLQAFKHVTWSVGFSLGISFLIITFIAYFQVVQQLYCPSCHCFICSKKQKTRGNSLLSNTDAQTNCTRRLAFVSCTFYLFTNILVWTSYPICYTYDCDPNRPNRISKLRANSYYVAGFDAEIIAKCTLYLLFIGRLYTPNFQKIYQYPRRLLYLLWFIVFIIWAMATVVSALFGVYFFSSKNDLNLGSINDINLIYICSIGTFVLMDLVLSLITLYLFIKPLFNYYPSIDLRNDSMRNSLFPQKIKMRQQIKKYCILSCIAILSSTIYAFTAIGRQVFKMNWFISGKLEDDIYSIISNMLLMIDSIIAINCIYFGFVNNRYSWIVHAILSLFCCKCKDNKYECCYCKCNICIKCIECTHDCFYYLCCHATHNKYYHDNQQSDQMDSKDQDHDKIIFDNDEDTNSMMLKPSTHSTVQTTF